MRRNGGAGARSHNPGQCATTQRPAPPVIPQHAEGVGRPQLTFVPIEVPLTAWAQTEQAGIHRRAGCTGVYRHRFSRFVGTELDAPATGCVDEVQALLGRAVPESRCRGASRSSRSARVHAHQHDVQRHCSNAGRAAQIPEVCTGHLIRKVPVTVLSRCLQFNLRLRGPETVFV